MSSTEVRLSPPTPDEYTLRAARAGSRPAREAVIAGYLPLVDNLVAWAAPGDAGADEVVRQTLRHLAGGFDGRLEPARLRSWLVTLALRHLRDMDRTPIGRPGADIVDQLVAEPGLSPERRTLAEATRWLDPGDRELLALWWLAACGQLDRADLPAALDLPADQVAAQVLRLRERLDAGRHVVRALSDPPPCPAFADLVREWHGRPAAPWRERLDRHTRDCPACRPRREPLAEPDGLLAGLPLVAPAPHLADRVAHLATAHHRVERPARARSVAAVAACLVLVAGAGLAVVLATRADGQPAAVVAGEPGAAASSGNPSPAAPTTGARGPATGATAAPEFSDQVPVVPVVLGITELGPLLQHDRVGARDNGQSTGYGGRSVWIFDDTVLRNPWGFLSNSGAVTTDLYAGDGISITGTNPFQPTGGTAPAELLPRTHAEEAFEAAHAPSAGCAGSPDQYCGVRFGFWPGPVIADPARHRLLVFYHKLCRSGPAGTPCSGELGRPLGSGVAQLDMASGRVSRLTATAASPVASVEGTDPTMFFPASTEYTSAALVVRNSVYVYGDCHLACRLARVPLGRVADRSRWQFFTGRDATGADQWSADPAGAVATIEAGGAGSTVQWCPAMHGFLNVFMPYGSNTIMYQLGGSPFGPWSWSYPLLVTNADGPQANYAAFGHAEYAQDGGLVQYVTYYQPATGAQRLVKVSFLG